MVKKIDIESLRVDSLDNISVLNLEDYKVLPTEKIEKVKPLISLKDRDKSIDLFKLASVSLVFGLEKSRKSTFIKTIIAAVNKGYNDKMTCEYKDVEACVIDTEQNREEIQYVLRSIYFLSNKYVDYYSFVEIGFKDKMKLIEEYLEGHANTKLLVIDNIADFVSDFNSNVESQEVFNWLLAVANKYNIHILLVMHQNTTVENKKPTGFLGTIALRKCNLVIRIEEKQDTDNTSLIECFRIRGSRKFQKFKLMVDNHGNPYLYDLSPSELEETQPQKVTRY